ncbi:APC family permease [Streptantibioticus ferralitis]|uniref:Amino acid permease n=1 Tax=Streptantibioticus ferralitis TaxID=236510 RepID=A0ABT5Z5U3_9ACTN|nr:amino acid permease [Streptantibioticus ferralitis]MDF2258916.1 amino acid permease [Streptantibioticus ferralitis]
MSRVDQAIPAAKVRQIPDRPGGLNLAQGIALYVGAVLGTGVLALPGMAAKQAGPASLLSWLALVVMSVPLAATFAALAARYPDSGGVSTYVRQAFGDRAAAVVGWWFYLGAPVGIPALAFFGASYLARATGGGWGESVACAALLLAIGFLANAFGVRISGPVQLALSGTLALLLVVAVAVALPHARLSNLHPFAPHGWAAVGSAGALLVWSFTGWETVTHLSAEFARPARDLKRATVGALVIVGVLYLSLATVTVLALGSTAGASTTPLASLLQTGLGGYGADVASVVAVLITLGTINAYVASTAKLGAALARDGALPRRLASGAQPGGVPRGSLLTVAAISSGVFIAAAVTRMDLQPLVLSTTACLGAVYAIGSAAGVRLLRRTSRAGVVAAASAFGIVVLLLALTGWYLFWPLILAAAALTVTGVRSGAGRAPGSAAGHAA